jgi:hypothetical protein
MNSLIASLIQASEEALASHGRTIMLHALSSGSEKLDDPRPRQTSHRRAKTSSNSNLDSHLNIKDVLGNFYQVYAPEKLDQITQVLKHFEGREDHLLRTLENKYNVKFRSDGIAVVVVDQADDSDVA